MSRFKDNFWRIATNNAVLSILHKNRTVVSMTEVKYFNTYGTDNSTGDCASDTAFVLAAFAPR